MTNKSPLIACIIHRKPAPETYTPQSAAAGTMEVTLLHADGTATQNLLPIVAGASLSEVGKNAAGNIGNSLKIYDEGDMYIAVSLDADPAVTAIGTKVRLTFGNMRELFMTDPVNQSIYLPQFVLGSFTEAQETANRMERRISFATGTEAQYPEVLVAGTRMLGYKPVRRPLAIT